MVSVRLSPKTNEGGIAIEKFLEKKSASITAFIIHRDTPDYVHENACGGFEGVVEEVHGGPEFVPDHFIMAPCIESLMYTIKKVTTVEDKSQNKVLVQFDGPDECVGYGIATVYKGKSNPTEEEGVLVHPDWFKKYPHIEDRDVEIAMLGVLTGVAFHLKAAKIELVCMWVRPSEEASFKQAKLFAKKSQVENPYKGGKKPVFLDAPTFNEYFKKRFPILEVQSEVGQAAELDKAASALPLMKRKAA